MSNLSFEIQKAFKLKKKNGPLCGKNIFRWDLHNHPFFFKPPKECFLKALVQINFAEHLRENVSFVQILYIKQSGSQISKGEIVNLEVGGSFNTKKDCKKWQGCYQMKIQVKTQLLLNFQEKRFFRSDFVYQTVFFRNFPLGIRSISKKILKKLIKKSFLPNFFFTLALQMPFRLF